MSSERVALISVADKDGIVDFARQLRQRGYRIIASGGTADTIQTGGVSLERLSKYVGTEAELGHAVVTLFPHIHIGLQAPDGPDGAVALRRWNFPRIDLVVAVPYDLPGAIQQFGSDPAQLYQHGFDVGGFALLASGAKGGRDVLCSPDQYELYLRWLDEGRPHEQGIKLRLASVAMMLEAGHRAELAEYLKRLGIGQGADDEFVESLLKAAG